MLSPTFLFYFAEAGTAPGSSEHMVTIFIIEIVLMLFLGRLLGEVMQRIGQPAVMGQLIAGIILGPSVFGHFAPHAYSTVFPDAAAQKKMIDAISQLGVLMLLLLTGMETDLRLVNKMRRTAIITSLSGILFPFICGYILGEYLPDSLVPDPERRLVTSLFIATALSISSVKIVAMVIMEVGFLRRNIGQIILASAILDDTIGWIIIAIIGGIASGGAINFSGAAFSFLGTIVFLAFSFTIGRRLIAHLIRWTNDHLIMDMPVITAILVVMMLAALLTEYIGVHTVLGAFVIGILVGQSPILTKHIEEQLRGLIVALFAPIFFAVAGREIDLTVLNSWSQVKLAIAFIVIASVGKVLGAYVGGRLSNLGGRASTALAIGMNARGSTEVIVATIGLSLGVLNRDLFTLIVVMAIVTTLVTPPLLRWALKRIPPTGEEKKRLEREETESREFVPNIERMLVAADDSENGRLASLLAGLLAGTRQIMTTVLEIKLPTKSIDAEMPGDLAQASAEVARENTAELPDAPADAPLSVAVEQDRSFADAVLKEIEKGYDVAFLGIDDSGFRAERSGKAGEAIAEILESFSGVTAIAVQKDHDPKIDPKRALKILLPITGTDYSHRAAEIAVALAKASSGTLTALHVAPPAKEIDVLRHPSDLMSAGRVVVQQIKELGARNDVKVRPLVRVRASAELEIVKQAAAGRHDLMVVGVKSRGGKQKLFFGRRISVLLEKSQCSILLVNS